MENPNKSPATAKAAEAPKTATPKAAAPTAAPAAAKAAPAATEAPKQPQAEVAKAPLSPAQEKALDGGFVASASKETESSQGVANGEAASDGLTDREAMMFRALMVTLSLPNNMRTYGIKHHADRFVDFCLSHGDRGRHAMDMIEIIAQHRPGTLGTDEFKTEINAVFNILDHGEDTTRNDASIRQQRLDAAQRLARATKSNAMPAEAVAEMQKTELQRKARAFDADGASDDQAAAASRLYSGE